MAAAVTHGADQLQTAAGDLVKLQYLGAEVRLQPANMTEPGFEHLLGVKEKRAGGDEAGLRILEPEAAERYDSKMGR